MTPRILRCTKDDNRKPRWGARAASPNENPHPRAWQLSSLSGAGGLFCELTLMPLQPCRLSRRSFLQSAAAMAAQNRSSVLAYVGTNSSPQGPDGSQGNGQGIYLFEMNPSTGALTQRELTSNSSSPTWLAFNPSGTHIYSANETNMFEGAGSVSSYSVDRSSGHLTLVNTVSSEGAGPAHLSIHPAGKHVLVANYTGWNGSGAADRIEGRVGRAYRREARSRRVGIGARR